MSWLASGTTYKVQKSDQWKKDETNVMEEDFDWDENDRSK